MKCSAPILAACAAALFSVHAAADDFCGPGRHLGSENDGPGKSWVCVPDAAPSLRAPSGGGPAAAGRALQIGAGIIGAVGGLMSNVRPTDNLGPAQQDTEGYGTRSREHNRAAILALNKGQYTKAAINFQMAAAEADRAGNVAEREANLKNMQIATANNYLHAGFDLEKAGKTAAASENYLRAKLIATSIGEQQLAATIGGHNDKLVAAGGKGTRPTDSDCFYLNGEFTCQ